MDFTKWTAAALRALDPLVWSYFMATADPTESTEHDNDAWQRIEIVPRVLRGVENIDTTATLPACAPLASPLVIAPTAGHGLACEEAELASARAAASTGTLMIYSHSATVGVEEFGAAATSPWWAQAYLLRDPARTRDYLDRAAAAGACAIVLTVDGSVPVGSASFRTTVQARLSAVAGNFPGSTWTEMVATYATGLTVDHISTVAGQTTLPVYAKGVLNPIDAARAVDAGAAGIIVSNHGRRQMGGVVSTAKALPRIVDAVAERVPVIVDGGIRSGLDVFRALALGASAVAVGRPVLWGLAADGAAGVTAVLTTLIEELRQAMAGAGVGRIEQISRDLVRPPSW
ncbi:alpha-hydroxy-acid oxidizing protein [Planosporangium thailandense]|uniref:Alpha-hydroxy-acid oxidizing protein n=1 Tax=Planosporangium thailandense TaxID=765197 RepID=A0ABX0Y4G9_9ACTN|nr:alpha-hydroxy-acid oxidizing protein [Planosporangium thailandense]NJC72918.1 alpha-hydroxy-acid oxidizing protein [Planosporangium thailandense]